jgi:hypothetical protein
VAFVLGLALIGCPAMFLHGQQPQDAVPQSSSQAANPVRQDLVSEKQQKEMGEEDATYLQSRTVIKYDHKWVPGDVSKDRFRSYSQVAFGPKKSWAFTVELPFLVHVATPQQEVTGVGDLEFKVGKLITNGERFRQAVGGQLNLQTSSNEMIGGSATVMKVLYLNSYALAKKWMVFGSLNYAHSVHLAGVASTVSEIEPEVTISRSFRPFGVYLHFDNYYDFPVSEWGTTVKFGVAKTLGRKHSWTMDIYNEYALNAYARAKFTNDLGISVTRFFGAN